MLIICQTMCIFLSAIMWHFWHFTTPNKNSLFCWLPFCWHNFPREIEFNPRMNSTKCLQYVNFSTVKVQSAPLESVFLFRQTKLFLCSERYKERTTPRWRVVTARDFYSMKPLNAILPRELFNSQTTQRTAFKINLAVLCTAIGCYRENVRRLREN